MLVRCRIDDDLRVVFLKDFAQRRLVGDGTDLDLKVKGVAVCNLQFLLHIVGTVLVDIQNDDLPGAHFCQLTAKLRTDGTATTRDKHHLVAVISTGLFVRNFDLLTEQQFFDIELTQITLLSCGLHYRVVVDFHLITGIDVPGIQLTFLFIAEVLDGEHHFLHLMLA